MTFGNPLNEKEASYCAADAFEHGVNFFDTADIYPRGNAGCSEIMLGKAVKLFRNQVILATKVGGPMGPGPENAGLGRNHIFHAVEESLKRLDTDYIDLYYLHFPDPQVSAEELADTMKALVKSGKIRYWGVSNFPAWKVCELKYLSDKGGPAVFESVYNLISRSADEELIPFIKAHPMGLTAYNPLAGGLLTGKYLHMKSQGRLLSDAGYRERYFQDYQQNATRQLSEIASSIDLSLLELSFQWLRSRDFLTSVILGFSSRQQLEENLSFFKEDKVPDMPAKALDAIWKELDRKCWPYARFN